MFGSILYIGGIIWIMSQKRKAQAFATERIFMLEKSKNPDVTHDTSHSALEGEKEDHPLHHNQLEAIP